MTFVIKDHVDKYGWTCGNHKFDIEGYNYIIERNSIFTRGDLIKSNYEKLAFILKNYEEIDSILLETLNYQAAITDNFNKISDYDFSNKPKENAGVGEIEFKTALHLALQAKNTRIINLLLFYMGKLPLKNDYILKDIFRKLIKY